MSGRALVGGLELRCTFAEGSQAQSCILTVCRMENEFCTNIIISRENSQSVGQITNLQPDVYIVKVVAEVESDGQVTIHKRTDVLELMIAQSPFTTTFTTPGYSKYLFSRIQWYYCICVPM